MSPAEGVRDVVLLHGWGADAEVWSGLAARLAPRYRVRTPGWLAQWPAREPTIDKAADWIARRAPRRCHVIGWSLGGQVAIAWARRRPHQVACVGLIGATPCLVRRAGWSCGLDSRTLADFAQAFASDPSAALRRFAALQAQGDRRGRAVIRALQHAAAPAGGPALATGLALLRATDLRATLGRVAQPVLVLHGDRDPVVPLAAARRTSRRLPDARLVVLRGAAHAPFLSRPREVAAELKAFLDE